MEINLSPSLLNNHMTKTTKRNLYTYQLLGTINCLNNPAVKKLFVFHSKLKNETIWNALATNAYLGKKYLFSCRNYRGSYYLVDWEEKEAKHE